MLAAPCWASLNPCPIPCPPNREGMPRVERDRSHNGEAATTDGNRESTAATFCLGTKAKAIIEQRMVLGGRQDCPDDRT